MRTLAIGDIHGCLRALDALLEVVAPGPGDRIITLGDYVDRGPDSAGVLDRLIDLHETGRLVALRGNHDQMFLDARRGPDDLWLAYGGWQTLASYGLVIPQAADLQKEVPRRHWQFLEDVCMDWFETDTHFFVHGTVYPDLPLADQPTYVLYWEKLTGPVDHVSGKVMVCGHTKQKSGRPLNLGTTVCIDTGIYEPDGWLTCLDVDTGRYWQANQLGKKRADWLEEPEED
jgi:serine/threonine protein phosphatase 1